ncbi:hypothetical protein DITRI_Ditri18aG0109400 [Diplodiscus trichospermus]
MEVSRLGSLPRGFNFQGMVFAGWQGDCQIDGDVAEIFQGVVRVKVPGFRLCGCVALHRVHGGLTFSNLRDHTGIAQLHSLQVSFYAHATVKDLRLEYVVVVDGVVPSRPSESVNKKMWRSCSDVECCKIKATINGYHYQRG